MGKNEFTLQIIPFLENSFIYSMPLCCCHWPFKPTAGASTGTATYKMGKSRVGSNVHLGYLFGIRRQLGTLRKR
jgi:hypothetical protein